MLDDAPHHRAAPPAENASETWLLLAPPELAQRLARLAPDVTIVVAGTSRALKQRLDALRPRLAIAVIPTADRRVVEILASIARRRPEVGTLLVDHPDAIGERLDAMRAGVIDALPASIDPEELVGRLRLLADRTQRSPRGDRVAVGENIELDVAGHVLLRDGLPIHLRPKEFDLLSALAAEPGRAFSRRELHEQVWGSQLPDSRRVDVHVRWLRLKFEPQPNRPRHLITVRGLGYRLQPSTR